MEELIVYLFLVALVGYGYYIYDQKIRLFLPSEFGTDDFQRIARWESCAWRDRAYKEGITRSEWQQVNLHQLNAITNELKKRCDIEQK